jgi:hypothetical protein
MLMELEPDPGISLTLEPVQLEPERLANVFQCNCRILCKQLHRYNFLQFPRQASILVGKVTSRLYLLGRWSLLSHKTKPKQKETAQSLRYEAKRKQANNTVSDPAAATTTINIIVSHQTDIFLCMDQQVAPTKNNTKRTLHHLLPPSKAPPPKKKNQKKKKKKKKETFSFTSISFGSSSHDITMSLASEYRASP